MGADRNPIFSATDHGNHAGFEEALSVMVSQYANKDAILKRSGASGDGAAGAARRKFRAQFFAIIPEAQATAIKSGSVPAD